MARAISTNSEGVVTSIEPVEMILNPLGEPLPSLGGNLFGNLQNVAGGVLGTGAATGGSGGDNALNDFFDTTSGVISQPESGATTSSTSSGSTSAAIDTSTAYNQEQQQQQQQSGGVFNTLLYPFKNLIGGGITSKAPANTANEATQPTITSSPVRATTTPALTPPPTAADVDTLGERTIDTLSSAPPGTQTSKLLGLVMILAALMAKAAHVLG